MHLHAKRYAERGDSSVLIQHLLKQKDGFPPNLQYGDAALR